jgi:hypothetical protein
MWRQEKHAEGLIADGKVILQLVLQNGYVILHTEFRRHDSITLNGFWNGKLMPLQLQFIHRFLCFQVCHIILMTLYSMLRFYWLFSWWLYLTLSPTGGKIWGTILPTENLVPDGFIIILWLLLWDHYVVVSPFLPHRSATADTTTPTFVCRFLIYCCTNELHLHL